MVDIPASVRNVMKSSMSRLTMTRRGSTMRSACRGENGVATSVRYLKWSGGSISTGTIFSAWGNGGMMSGVDENVSASWKIS